MVLHEWGANRAVERVIFMCIARCHFIYPMLIGPHLSLTAANKKATLARLISHHNYAVLIILIILIARAMNSNARTQWQKRIQGNFLFFFHRFLVERKVLHVNSCQQYLIIIISGCGDNEPTLAVRVCNRSLFRAAGGAATCVRTVDGQVSQTDMRQITQKQQQGQVCNL